MTKLVCVSLTLVSSLIIQWGCQIPGAEETSLPTYYETQPNDQRISGANTTLIKLPKPMSSPPNSVRITKVAAPDSATNFNGTLSYVTQGNATAIFDVKFKIPSGALAESILISMTIDSSYAKISFEPDGLQFLIPAEINVSLLNLDPFGRFEFTQFVYVTSNGTFVPQEFERMVVSGASGNIMLKKGKIRHFSAYAFGRRTGAQNGL